MKVILYTDGACSGNPGIGGWGLSLSRTDKDYVKQWYGGAVSTTNNRMEMTAVIEGLKALKTNCEVDIYSDSAYTVNAFLEGWIYNWEKKDWKKSENKPVLNTDLWKALLELSRVHILHFHKVKGHSDNDINNRCDELARYGIEIIRQKIADNTMFKDGILPATLTETKI